jgi:hypothetical protein
MLVLMTGLSTQVVESLVPRIEARLELIGSSGLYLSDILLDLADWCKVISSANYLTDDFVFFGNAEHLSLSCSSSHLGHDRCQGLRDALDVVVHGLHGGCDVLQEEQLPREEDDEDPDDLGHEHLAGSVATSAVVVVIHSSRHPSLAWLRLWLQLPLGLLVIAELGLSSLHLLPIGEYLCQI